MVLRYTKNNVNFFISVDRLATLPPLDISVITQRYQENGEKYQQYIATHKVQSESQPKDTEEEVVFEEDDLDEGFEESESLVNEKIDENIFVNPYEDLNFNKSFLQDIINFISEVSLQCDIAIESINLQCSHSLLEVNYIYCFIIDNICYVVDNDQVKIIEKDSELNIF